MTEIDRSKWPPPEESEMMPWYNQTFDHGFIALHPFFAIDGLNPSLCDHGTHVFSGSERPEGVGLLEWMDEKSAARREGKELFSGSIPEIAKRFGRRIGWREICQAVGLQDHCALDQALRTNIMGLRKELAAPAAAQAMTDYCEAAQIFLPTEGSFQPLMETALVALLRRAGLTEIIVANEFGDDEKSMPVEALEGEVAWELRDDLVKWGVRRLVAPDRSLLIWVHWDSFYTAIFGTEERLRDTQVSADLEGFWCSAKTTTYWLNEDAVPLVQ